jgi:hypothetical protein
LPTLLLWIATLAGALLIVAGIVGSHPRPSDGQWQTLSPSARAGLTVVGLVMILGGWAMNQGWFKTPRSVSAAAAPRYSDARGDRPIDSLWNEAEVAEREARQHPRTTLPPATALPAMPESTPDVASAAVPTAATPTPALEPVPTIAAPLPQAAPAAPVAALAATAVPAASTATPATAAAPAPAPTQLAAAATPPVCNCDTPAVAPKPVASRARPTTRSTSRTGSSNAGRGDVVSVCALQRQYGISAGGRGVASPTYRSTGSRAAASLRVQDSLGPDQHREQLRISIDGGAAATLSLGPSNSSGSVSLRSPRDGARYRLSGYTEYRDGRRVPLSGEGFLDGGAQRYELRLADEFSGSAFLEPAS